MRDPFRMPPKRHDVLFVCPAPGRQAVSTRPDADHRLFPLMEGTSSNMRLSSLLPLNRWQIHADAINLLDYWPGQITSASQSVMKATWDDLRPQTREYATVILFGRLVAKAANIPDNAPCFISMRLGEQRVAVVPHPSGLNRVWNDPNVVVQARVFFVRLFNKDFRMIEACYNSGQLNEIDK